VPCRVPTARHRHLLSVRDPTDADLEDLDRMWLDQLSGRRNFDPNAFMGLINDLLLFEREGWRGLFAALLNGAGFLAKLSDFFARHRHGLRGQNGWYPYAILSSEMPWSRTDLSNSRWKVTDGPSHRGGARSALAI
jgi:hypothetical protein